ncbi:MAG: hypothetical protein ACTHU0_26825 [Kofleriaceae bacterium]
MTIGKYLRHLKRTEFRIPTRSGAFVVSATPIQLWMYAQAGVDVSTYNPSSDQMTPDQRAWFDSAAGAQAMGFRDEHPFCAGLRFYQHRDRLVYVIGEHRSKSRTLPVVLYARPDIDTYVVVRNNFYNYKISVSAPRLVRNELFPYLFHTSPPVEPDYTGDPLASCYFEGFPDDLIFDYHSVAEREGHGRWSCEVWGETSYKMACFGIMQGLGLIHPKQWNTREAHRRQLDVSSALERADRERYERELAEESA